MDTINFFLVVKVVSKNEGGCRVVAPALDLLVECVLMQLSELLPPYGREIKQNYK